MARARGGDFTGGITDGSGGNNDESWRENIPQRDDPSNNWGGYRPTTYEYTDWSGNKASAPYVPNAPRPDAFNNVPGVENDPSDALGLWNMSRYYNSGAIRPPQWYIHGGVSSYGDSSAYPYYEREDYKNTWGSGRDPWADAHPNIKWSRGYLETDHPGWDSEGNVIGGYNPDGSTRPYVPGPNDRYQGGGPPPPKVRGNGWGGQDWWNQGGGGQNSGAGSPASTQRFGGMGGGSSNVSARTGMPNRGGGTQIPYGGYGPGPSGTSRVGGGGVMMQAPNQQGGLTATQGSQAPMSDDEIRAQAWRQRDEIAKQVRGSQGYKDRVAAGAKQRPYMRSLTTDKEWADLQANPQFRFDYDFIAPSGGQGGDVQQAYIRDAMTLQRDRYGNARLAWSDPKQHGKTSVDDMLAKYQDPKQPYHMDRATAEGKMAAFNQQFDKSGNGAWGKGSGPNVIDNFMRRLNESESEKKSFLTRLASGEKSGLTNMYGEAYKLYQQHPELFEKGGYQQGMGDLAVGGDQYDKYFDDKGNFRAQPMGSSVTPPAAQGTPRPNPAGAPPARQNLPEVTNFGVPGYANGNPYYNKFGELRRPFRNAPSTDWNMGGYGGAAYFGNQTYDYFPQSSGMGAQPQAMGSALPGGYGGMDSLSAMLSFGGF